MLARAGLCVFFPVLRIRMKSGSYNFFPPFGNLMGKVGRILPTFTTFPTLRFPTFGAAIIKSITFPAHVFLMETCPCKERTQPWSQPWVERDLPSKNLSHFPTLPTEFPSFPTDLNAKILEFTACKLCPTYAYGLTSVWRHFFMCWK